ncbi:MAG: hypothetical protein IPJ08_02230 [Burkholderiales bacterium]|nr:hypothetical protein [Burkholderiales bacterium]
MIPSNVVSAYIQAHFGKIGEIAGKKLDLILNDPVMQAKLSAKAISKLTDIYKSSQSNQQKTQAFISEIENDLSGYSSQPTGSQKIVAEYSGNYGVMKLTWDRAINRSACQRQKCTCPDGANAPLGPLQTCYYQVFDYLFNTWVQRSSPPSCQYTTDTIDIEPSYSVYRNGKLIAQYGENRANAGTSFGFENFNLNLVLKSPQTDLVRSSPFYDLDTYNSKIGTPLVYTLTAQSQGCGPNYNNFSTGTYYKSEQIVVDATGDGIPDFYPASVLAAKRAELPNGYVAGMGTFKYVSGWSGGISGMTISNDGTGTITNIAAKCTVSSANVTTPLPSSLAPGQSAMLQMWVFGGGSGGRCEPQIFGTNAANNGVVFKVGI